MEKRLFEEKRKKEVLVDEARNRAENYKELCESYQPTRFEKFVNGLREKFKPVFNVAVPVVLTVAMATVFVACNTEEQSPEAPDNENEPSTPNTPSTPGNTERPDDSDQPENPDNPNEPDDPVVDPDDPTPQPSEELTEAEIVKYLDELLTTNYQRVLGNYTQINRYIAIDFKVEDGVNNLYLLLDYANKSHDRIQSFVRIPMTCEMTEENIKNGTFKPEKSTSGKFVISNIPTNDNVDRNTIDAVLKKISLEDLSDDVNDYDIATVEIAPTSDGDFYRGNKYTIYLVNETGIRVISIRADRYNIDDPILTSILNGTENVTYFIDKNEIVHVFEDDALYNVEGLGN